MQKRMANIKLDMLDVAIKAIYAKAEVQLEQYSKAFELLTELGFKASTEQTEAIVNAYGDRDKIIHARDDLINEFKKMQSAIGKAEAKAGRF